MYFGKRLKEIRKEKGILQRQLSASLEIDTPMYSKIERGERKAKHVQVEKLAKELNVDKQELLTLWLASQIYELVKDYQYAKDAIKLVEQSLKVE